MKKILLISLLLSTLLISYGDGAEEKYVDWVPSLTGDTSPTSDDLIVVIDSPGGTPANRKVTLGNLPKGMSLLTMSDWPSGLDLTELSYVNGVTSAIQTQLNAKVDPASNSQTWGSGAAATIPWTFNVSGTDTTFTPGNGTFTFSHPIEVVGNIKIGEANSAYSRYIGAIPGGNLYAGMQVDSVADGGGYSQSLAFHTSHTGVGDATRMTIDKDGNVGVNTIIPRYRNTTIGVLSSLLSDDATNYEGLTITPATGSITLAGVSGGSGSANLDIVLTPKGTGVVKSGATAVSLAGHTHSYLPLAGGTLTGGFITMTPTTAGAGLTLPHGVAPSSPVNGNIWTTTAGLYAQINSGTVGPFAVVG